MNKNRPPRKRYYPLWWLLLAIAHLPMPVLYLFSDLLKVLIYNVFGYRKKVVRQNLERSFPEKTAAEIDRLMPAFYRNFCDIIVETLMLATITNKELISRVKLTNTAGIFEYIVAGKPVILMGSHQGNWEWALPSGAMQFNFPVDGIYKILSNDFFEWFLLAMRTRAGAYLFDMKDTMREFIKRKNIPRAISMLSDQTPPRGEIQYWTSFLNQETGFFVGAEKLARMFKYPVFFMVNRREKRGHYILTFEQIYDGVSELPANDFPLTEKYARLLEQTIRNYPADYLWSHRRWKHQKPATNPHPVIA